MAISNPKAMAAADVVDVDKATDRDTDLAITLSAKEADDAANLIKAEEVAYKQALENSLAGATDGSQLAEQALMMQGLSGAKASSDSNGSAHAGSQTNLVEVAASAPTPTPTLAYSAPATPLKVECSAENPVSCTACAILPASMVLNFALRRRLQTRSHCNCST